MIRDIKELPLIQKIAIALSLVLFIISLTQPAFYTGSDKSDSWSNSLGLLLLGWMSFLGGNFVATFFWLANPCYFFAIFFLIMKSKIGLIFAGMAAALAVGFSLLNEIMVSESGSYALFTVAAGYVLWMLSMVVLFLGSVLSLFIHPKKHYQQY